MPGLELLDLAISLVFLYLLLSLICSVLGEFVELLYKRRSAELLRGIKEMLNDPEGRVLVSKLYEHTLIFSLFKGGFDPGKPTARNLPSYIPTGNFVAALIGVLVPESRGTVTIGQLKESISRLENEKVKTALTHVISDASDDIDKARANIAEWYDSTMGRVSGWYKRHTQIVTLILGGLLAVAFNADSIDVSRDLARDRAMREAFVAVAQGYAQREPVGSSPRDFKDVFAEVQKAPVDIGLPIGWEARNVPNDTMDWLLKIVGWLLTGAATSLGASFWFDVLKKLVNIRATVKPDTAKSG